MVRAIELSITTREGVFEVNASTRILSTALTTFALAGLGMTHSTSANPPSQAGSPSATTCTTGTTTVFTYDTPGDKQKGDKQDGDKQKGDKQDGDKQKGDDEETKCPIPGGTPGGSGPPAPVPEPGSIATMSLGALGTVILILRARKTRSGGSPL
jgi:hypothetical protein